MVYTLEYLRNNLNKDSDFVKKYLSVIDDDADDTILNEFVKEFSSKIDVDIQDKISNGELVLQDIDNYESYLQELELDEDDEEQGILIKGKPNINGTIINLMLGCALSDDSALTKNTIEFILKMFQKATVSETYNNYVEIFPKFCLEVLGGNQAVQEEIGKLGSVLNSFTDVLEKKTKQLQASEYKHALINKYTLKI